MVASAAVHAYGWRNAIARQHGTDGHAAAKRLCKTQNIGTDSEVFTGKHKTGAAQTRLDFIDDEQNVSLRAERLYRTHIFGVRWANTTLALNRFQDDRRGCFPHRAAQSVDVIERNEGKARQQWLELIAILERRAERAHGSAVETAHGTNELGFPAGVAGKLDGSFHALGA